MRRARTRITLAYIPDISISSPDIFGGIVMKKGSEKFYGNNILHIKGGEFMRFYCNFLFSALQMPGGRGIL